MKSTYLRAGAAALACALALSGCGGSDGDKLLRVTVYGINKGDLVLQNNGANDLKITTPGQHYFDDMLETDESYNVTVKSVPANVEKCEVIRGTGRAVLHVSDVQVSCIIKSHDLRGTITGLGSAAGLVLVNGADRVPVEPGATTFAMSKVPEDAPYGITILTQPAGRTCTVVNGVGKMGSAAIDNVAVNCTATGG